MVLLSQLRLPPYAASIATCASATVKVRAAVEPSNP